ncbi:SAM-dependent methyltransferase [Leeia sp. TBRC 13508]|uniref:SAM-dependent methyltransferase n=1 Tax=Leeia speluncae TaxID=2884804 RepID=A0ABS8D840_9NEIS|nr:SAM-dependent methyltransferase [Leeia speluncae]MCB6184365.1 SAM-dependent methyltransferase [Leeia speluncae]
MKGTLYLIPAPLDENMALVGTIPEATRQVTRRLQHFVVEHPKTARAYLKQSGTDAPLQSLSLATLNEHTSNQELLPLLKPLEDGLDIGLLSEAGCPAVADPGAQLVALAHERNIRVVPLVGPSSILMAVMASGLNGQKFSFQGYLPASADERTQTLKKLESHSRTQNETILFIETPYRNEAMFDTLLSTLNSQTKLSIAADITCESEWIKTLSIAEWKKTEKPSLKKRPALFSFLA